MPEGPEATYLSETMHEHFHNKKLISVKWLSGRYVHHGVPNNFKDFEKMLPLKCTSIQNKGKVIFINFDSDWTIISKLGMTGWWYKDYDKPTWRKIDTDVIFDFDGSTLNYSDIRNFGTITITNDPKVVQKELSQIAPDIIDTETTLNVLKDRISKLSSVKKEWLIEDAIMDQKLIVSGIGNYLKAEILYDSRISPLRKIKDISEDEWEQFYTSAKKVVKRMYKALSNKKIPDAYMNAMYIYSKDTDPYGNEVLKRKTKTGRTTFWVKELQK